MTTQYIPICPHGVQIITHCPICALEQRLKAPSPPDARDAEIASLRTALSAAESRARLAEEDAERWTFCLANVSRFNRIVRDVENSLSDSLQLPWPDFRDEGKRRLVAAIDAARGKERP